MSMFKILWVGTFSMFEWYRNVKVAWERFRILKSITILFEMDVARLQLQKDPTPKKKCQKKAAEETLETARYQIRY